MAQHRSARHPSLASRLVRAVFSLLALAALGAGLPWLLWRATWAAAADGVDDFTHLFSQTDTTGAVLLVLAGIGWLAWAAFVFAVLLELPAQVRGRRAPRLPAGLHLSQRAAASLVGGLLLLLPAGTALASSSPAQAQSSSAEHIPGQTRASVADAAAPLSATAMPAAEVETTPPTYTVQDARPAESLWSIAEKLYGRGELYTLLVDANEGRTMVDGQRFVAEAPIRPGWQLALPADVPLAEESRISAQGGSVSVTADDVPAGGEHERVVAPGDSLSGIALDETGNAHAWPELFEENQGEEQPYGHTFTDPDLIYPGQKLTLPPEWSASNGDSAPPGRTEDPADDGDRREQTPPPTDKDDEEPTETEGPTSTPDGRESAPPEQDDREDEVAPAPDASSGPSQSAEATQKPSDEPSASHSPTPSAPAEPSPSESTDDGAAVVPPPTSSGTPSAGTPPQASQSPAGAPTSSPRSGGLRRVAGAGLLLATGIAAALATRRALQRRRRAPGETIAIAEEPSRAEAQLVAAAEEAPARQLDRALRTLAVAAEADGADLPALAAARITPRTLQVLPAAREAAPLTPFTAGPDGWWTLPEQAELLSDEDAASVAPPYPGLVTLGSSTSGDLVLVNLAQLQVVLLEGEQTDIEEVLTAVALELTEAPWAQDSELVTVGFGSELQGLLPSSRLSFTRESSHAVSDLAQRLLAAQQFPEEAHHPYLLCAKSLDPEAAWLLAEALEQAGEVPVALVAPAAGVAQLFPHAQVLDASADGAQYVDALDLPLTLQRLERAAYQQIVTAFQVANQSAEPAEGAWLNVPGEPRRVSEAAAHAPDPSASVEAKPVVHISTSGGPTSAAAPTAVPAAFMAASSDGAGLRLMPSPTPASGSAATGPGASSADSDGEPGPEPVNAASVLPPAERPTSPITPPAGGELTEVEELHVPEIRVLGPVEVAEVAASSHAPSLAQLAALLYFKPSRDSDLVSEDMSPNKPWKRDTLSARLKDLRTRLGTDSDGEPYVPRRTAKNDPCTISAKLRCDWTRFQQLAEQGLDAGSPGLPILEKALELVRGRPFGTHPLPWCDPLRQEMTVRIVDVAHTVATWRMAPGQVHDLAAARRAITVGLSADETSEVLYRDWMRIEHALGNRSGLHTAITNLQAMVHALRSDVEPETEALIDELMGRTAQNTHTR
ncbi:LysM peptidoglycan-binding domain-containing protein [Streptomyces sp. N35]|uniref:LysM peptidoglycan-binding domain-containing protein n=1 Tax=Streptomyces sp. N35 TaxID=2795730 RepID=UPI0018F72F85|nr:LysM peptidoglycan-binding domain-containing protein [Streptomyces sp. N35]